MIIGIDFGTSNSACSVRLDNGEIKSVILEPDSQSPYLLPSYWYFPEGNTPPLVGSSAKSAFINDGFIGRFILSLKSHLSNTALRVINIHGKAVSLERVVCFILKRIKESAEEQYGSISCVRAGRPVVLSDDPSIDQQIENRLREAYLMAGFPDPIFIPEPVAAAYNYKQQLRDSELVLVCDFGGGTLDYCLAVLEPVKSQKSDKIIKTNGVRIGGDDLTGSLMKLFWDYFGHSSRFLDFTRTKWLPFPNRIFHELSNWKNIWRLGEIEKEIQGYIRWGSDDPNALHRLIALLDADYYFKFLESLEQIKIKLSENAGIDFSYHKSPIEIDRIITRVEFDAVTENLMKRAEAELIRTLESAKVKSDDIQSVFLTGGSSQIPAFREIIARIFGDKRIRKGDTFTSVAQGLAAFKS